MKKSLKLLLTCTFSVILLLSACSSGNGEKKKSSKSANVEINKEGFPIVDEKIELTMMGPSTGLAEWKDMVVLQKYEEMTNIHFRFDTPPVSDFQTKLNLAFASGDIADVIYGAGSNNLTPGMEVDYGEQGILIPLENLIDKYAPNIKKMFEKNPDLLRSVTTVDGHIYSLPRVSKGPTASWKMGPMWYNGQWLDALGVKELPKTTDEFYELLKRFKTDDPNGNGKADEIPLSDVKEQHTRAWLMGAFGLKEWGIDEINGKVRYTPITDNYKEYITFMNKLFKEELLDPEVFSQSSEQKKAKGQENRLGLFQDWFSFFTTGESEEDADNNPMFYPLTSSFSDEPVIPRNPAIARGTFSITKNNSNPEATIRWIDYFYSQEGFEFLAQGPEGYLWEWIDEEAGTKKWLDAPEGYKTSEDYRGTLTPNYGISAPGLVVPIGGKEDTDFDKFIGSETKEKIEPYAEVPFPLVYLTKEEQKKINTIEVDLQSYVEQMEAKFITGVEPLSNWDKYVQTIQKMNIDEYIKIYQDAYDRWANS
ncbi:extracellular solute-binding protein [Bacillus sp. FSL K6-3431]|uniref:extracellular solute-binding protein n=1 Tax=Bacillus sp. FSL K6-3431 TaxID=2921500 RepID=UPI0030FA388C